VTISGTTYTVEKPEGARVFRSKRQTLMYLTGTPDARNWTWARYFKEERHQTTTAKLVSDLSVTTLDMFPWAFPEKITTVTGDVKVAKFGVDLAKRGHEVRKLLFAGFGGKIRSAGYDPDEILQEVYKGILIRNAGACPFDERKAGFGHYVHMVCNCIVSNYHRKMVRQRKIEPLADEADELSLEQAEGRGSSESEELVAADFGATLENDAPWGDPFGPTLESRVYPLLRAGYGRTEIADKLGLPPSLISKTLSNIRAGARVWNR
jgi:hypothetical protein